MCIASCHPPCAKAVEKEETLPPKTAEKDVDNELVVLFDTNAVRRNFFPKKLCMEPFYGYEWEVRTTENGERYYVNHATQVTQWEEPPRLPPVASHVAATPEPPPRGKKGVANTAPMVVEPVPIVAQPVDAAVEPQQQNEPAAPAPTKKKKSSYFARTTALTKAVLIGRMAPSKLWKSGWLTLDGTDRWVELHDGILTITTKIGGEEMFSAPMKYIQIVGDSATRETARRHRGKIGALEIAIYVEPELMNKEVQKQSRVGGFGWHNHLRVGHVAPETGLTATDLKRQNFSLFAVDAGDKQSWRITLDTAGKSIRDWAYVKHEVTDSCAYICGKK